MDQQTELAKVKARIRALTARTVERGCSEAEALAAAAKVGELLEVYGLSMSEVALREEACVQRRVTVTGPQRLALRWMYPALLRFCECRGWTDGRADFVLYGLEPDVQMAEYLLKVAEGALAWEEARFRESAEWLRSRATPQGRLRSFRYGFADRLGKRLEEITAAREQAAEARRVAAPPAAASASTALVLAKERKVEEGFRSLGVRLRTVYSTATVRDRGAYGSGQAAGGRVGLDRPVGRGPGAGRLK
ncbi:DUF7168 domain-containing protein [Paracraurococcus ruber]|uniref:DUF2786 domain-containing protein n=1 Tax=Paracraurococcus ruber TaxID=77675 RepID=A0ABS1CXZ6_9PROT|nr:DUF2786 domain-containing protein [Paracraurococcus ruber]MBK1658594.1 hypothetical protein [Paracraurococcus ruber]TDG28498.1 DUF2786 domain-containing protein [Paracraurococcus ruber]